MSKFIEKFTFISWPKWAQWAQNGYFPQIYMQMQMPSDSAHKGLNKTRLLTRTQSPFPQSENGEAISETPAKPFSKLTHSLSPTLRDPSDPSLCDHVAPRHRPLDPTCDLPPGPTLLHGCLRNSSSRHVVLWCLEESDPNVRATPHPIDLHEASASNSIFDPY